MICVKSLSDKQLLGCSKECSYRNHFVAAHFLGLLVHFMAPVCQAEKGEHKLYGVQYWCVVVVVCVVVGCVWFWSGHPRVVGQNGEVQPSCSLERDRLGPCVPGEGDTTRMQIRL